MKKNLHTLKLSKTPKNARNSFYKCVKCGWVVYKKNIVEAIEEADRTECIPKDFNSKIIKKKLTNFTRPPDIIQPHAHVPMEDDIYKYRMFSVHLKFRVCKICKCLYLLEE